MTRSDSSLKHYRNLIALLLLALVCVACSEGDLAGTDQDGFGQAAGEVAIPAVEAVRARVGRLPLEERLTGRVSALNQTEIYPEVAGPITEIFVEDGDRVVVGDPLVQLRDAEYAERYEQAVAGLEIAQARTRQAEASLQLLQNQMQRVQELRDRDLDTLANLETAQSEVAVAEADLELRQAEERQARSLAEERRLQLVNTTIRAPISGTVGQRNAEIGQLATTTTRLFVIGDLSQMEVEIMLTGRMLDHIREGMAVNLYSDSWSNRVLEASIDRISPFLDPNTMRTVAHVEVENANGLLMPGMFITADVLYGESEQAVLIPNSALYRHPRTGLQGVFVVGAPGEEPAPLVEHDLAGEIAPPRAVNFVPIEVVASGRMASGVTGIQEDDWVVTVGQNLLEGNVSEAKPRLISWERIMELQGLQSDDLLEVIEQQRRASSDSS